MSTPKANRSLERLPFDQYSRQKLAHDIIDSLRVGSERLSILDVGGYKGATHVFQPKDQVTVLDVFDIQEKDYIKGDATKMEFADGAYDYVVSFDVFEHIPRDKRERFVSECVRVARRGVIIAAPVGTPQNAQAEVFMNNVFRTLHGQDHQWLHEHIEYRLPEPGLSSKLLAKNGLHVFDVPSNYLPHWLLMQSAIFAASKTDKVGKAIEGLYADYNGHVYPDGYMTTTQNYRIVAVGVKSENDATKLRKVITAMSADNARSFDDTLHVIEQVTEVLTVAINELFEEGRTKSKELDQLRGKVEAQRQDNEGKAGRIAQLEGEVAAIKGSKSYQLAQRLSAVRNYPKRALKKGTKQ